MATNWQIGDQIQNRWDIHMILRGGMGIVYIVYDNEHRDVYAAKTFQDEVFARSPAAAERFTREALIWVNLDAHQNVARARFVQTIQGKPFLFLEYVSAGDLSGWIGTPRLTENLPQSLRFAINFCDGMTHALSKGITAHRDIKPQNCLITKDNTLKVTDFGLAKSSDDAGLVHTDEPSVAARRLGLVMTRTGMMAGTPTHMAPEQFDDGKRVDIRSDIYSFGVMLYQMIEGRLPFEGRTAKEFARLHRTQEPPMLSGQNPEINALVQRCLAKSPGDRFSGFGEVRDRIAQVYEGLTSERAPQPVVSKEISAIQWNNKGGSLTNLGWHEEAVQCFERAIELNPRDDLAWNNKASALAGLGRYDDCLACSSRAIELNPRNAVAWSNKGSALAGLGQLEGAVACYDQAIEVNRHYVEAWINKGNALGKLGRKEDAVDCCERALAINPHFAEAWCSKGNACEDLGRTEEALACYDKAIEINPRDEKAWNNKGTALYRLGRSEQAVACFNRALELKSDDEITWFNTGAAQNDLGRFEEAAVCYDRAIELNLGYSEAWSAKGIALAQLGRREHAVECHDRAIELNPNLVQAWFNKGVMLDALGRYEEALDCYEHAIELNPRLEGAWFNKGAVLVNAFRLYREALTCFEEAQRLGDSQAAPVIARLRELL